MAAKQTKPKNAVVLKSLKSLDLPVAPTVEETNDKCKVLTLRVPFTDVADYNDAASQVKAWEGEKDKLRSSVMEPALLELYRHNCAHPDSPSKTVKVVDEKGNACNVSINDTYEKAQLDPEKIIPALTALGQADPNKFIVEKLSIGFDTTVFFNADGSVKRDLYLDVLQAMSDIAADHHIPNPFSSKKVVSPVPGFFSKRWSGFSESLQPQVTKVFPATVTLKPTAPVDPIPGS